VGFGACFARLGVQSANPEAWRRFLGAHGGFASPPLEGTY